MKLVSSNAIINTCKYMLYTQKGTFLMKRDQIIKRT